MHRFDAKIPGQRRPERTQVPPGNANRKRRVIALAHHAAIEDRGAKHRLIEQVHAGCSIRIFAFKSAKSTFPTRVCGLLSRVTTWSGHLDGPSAPVGSSRR